MSTATADALRDYFAQGSTHPLTEEAEALVLDIALALEPYIAGRVAAGMQDGARREQRRILSLLEMRIGKHTSQLKQARLGTREWWTACARLTAFVTFRGEILRRVKEEEQ